MTAVDLNIGQLLAGQTSDGDRITPEYSPITVEIKKAKGQVSDHVTTKDTGDFHRGMFMDADNFPITFSSRDSKAPMLSEKYDGLFGLTKPSKKVLAEDIRPDVNQYYRRLISV